MRLALLLLTAELGLWELFCEHPTHVHCVFIFVSEDGLMVAPTLLIVKHAFFKVLDEDFATIGDGLHIDIAIIFILCPYVVLNGIPRPTPGIVLVLYKEVNDTALSDWHDLFGRRLWHVDFVSWGLPV